MEQRLTFITLGVSNLAASRKFYETVFEWKADSTSNDSVVFFKLNGIMLSLFGDHALAEDANVSAEGNGFRKFSLAYNLRSEKEVDDCFKALESKGAKAIKRPGKVFWGGYSSYVADPDGNLWEIAYNPYLPLDEKGNVV